MTTKKKESTKGTKLGRVFAITLVLVKSQLRASRSGRSGESIFRKASILAVIDAICFVVCAVIGYLGTGLILGLSIAESSALVKAVEESLVFIPALIPSVVLVAGVLFELSASSKFASSDSVNWLPVTQGEYVAASVISIAYTYSVVPSVIMGLSFWPSIKLGYGSTWVEMLLLSCISLIYGGAIVEILRAAINRVSNVVMSRARRGALVLRLAATIGVILVIEVIFNFVFLIDLVSSFTSALSAVAFLPVLWASLAVRASEAGHFPQNFLFSIATIIFAASMLLAAVKVRSRYWSPVPSQLTVTQREYSPGGGSSLAFRFLGLLDEEEATLVRKDLKGLTRRRELLQYFAIPFVLAIVFLFELFFTPGSNQAGGSQATAAVTDQLPIWFVGGLFGLIISSISFGQEGRSAPLLYSLPLNAKQVLRAKMFTSTLLAMTATVSIFVVVTVISRPPLLTLVEDFLVAVVITGQEICIGTAFGAKYPDFQERPRPRFVDPFGIILMVMVGLAVMFITALPAILSGALSSLPGVQPEVQPLFFVSVAFGVAVIGLSYSWASRQTRKLMMEFRW